MEATTATSGELHRLKNLRMWQPGQSGNPGGRAQGSRAVFSAMFMRDLQKVWVEHGAEAMAHTARSRPEIFVGICSKLLPQDVQIALQASLPGQLNPNDWQLLIEMMSAIKAALPDAGNRQPGEVLQLVTDAVRMANAPTIEG